jgi:hypothetical protein
MCVASVSLAADVLVLRDGRRVEGRLVGVSGDAIAFEHEGGRDDGRVREYDRADVRSIELDQAPGWGRGSFYAGGRGDRTALRERTVTVNAREQWTDTGIDVRAGQDVAFAATGAVRWGPGRRDGASGERNSPYNQNRPMPDHNAAALIGRIGANGDPFFIGENSESLRMRASGRLFLGINDDLITDNSGTLRVVVAH